MQPPLENPERNQELQDYWCSQMESVDLRRHQLPLARIKKIMKSDPDVHMIAAEAPIVFAKACEMFIIDLTMRSWAHAEESKRRTLLKSDITTAAYRSYAFDFLIDVVPGPDPAVVADQGFMPGAGESNCYPPGIETGFPGVDVSVMYPPPQQACPVAQPETTADGGEEEAEPSGGTSSVDLGV
ncbi:hypothetical protein AALP_AA8G281500 [Arabis alpina]|uniref:Transcription factor CBF/NF-Y/archaeal histone domain-containing protein n=1 Tax=Arabis alpina TaxID=50452 RepID=A0A087G9Z5_ARAAL|nr:hypothetical protein AALP_AA8G281500 [Arabis alpina]